MTFKEGHCSSMGLFHGMQFFKNRLLWHDSSAGSPVLTANLLPCGVLSPRSHQSCQGGCSSVAFQWDNNLLWASICSTVDLLGHHCLSHGFQGNHSSGAQSTFCLSFFIDQCACLAASTEIAPTDCDRTFGLN